MPIARLIVIAICPLWVWLMIQGVIRVFVIFYMNVMMRVVSKMSVVKVCPGRRLCQAVALVAKSKGV
jgi:hypothetical protein